MRIVLEFRDAAVDGPIPVRVGNEDRDEAIGKIGCDLPERCGFPGTRRVFDLVVVAVKEMEILQRLD